MIEPLEPDATLGPAVIFRQKSPPGVLTLLKNCRPHPRGWRLLVAAMGPVPLSYRKVQALRPR
jgi:hypothetical protein